MEQASGSKPLIDSDRIEGTRIYGASGHVIGAIKRLMIEKASGQTAYAVVAFEQARDANAEGQTIPWGKLVYDSALDGYRTDISEAELREAPRLAAGEAHDWADRKHEEELHEFYRIPPYWRAI